MQSKNSESRIPTLFFSCGFSHDDIDLYKEHGEIPYYLSKIYGCHAIIDDYYDIHNPNRKFFRNVELQSYKRHNVFTKLKKVLKVFYLAHKIDILCLFHIEPNTLFKMIAYRLGGGRGKIYVKLDLDVGGYMQNGKDMLVFKNLPLYLKIAHKIFKVMPDIYTVETKRAYNRLRNTYYGDLFEKEKIFLLPNGFDPEVLTECGIVKRSVSEKEDLIITVGRLGVVQKNTELFLDVLTKVDLKGWKVCLIGPVAEEFKDKIKNFYASHPNLKDTIVFTGPLSQTELYDYYSRAKIFVLTSVYESYAFVLAEAAYMQNYIITTDVGIAPELKELEIPEFISTSMHSSEIAIELQRVINMSGEEFNMMMRGNNLEKITWEYIFTHNQTLQRLMGK